VRRRRTTDNNHPFPRDPSLAEGPDVVRAEPVLVTGIAYNRLRHGRAGEGFEQQWQAARPA
jgi:hypothetical protein